MPEGLAIDPRDFLECIIQPTLERLAEGLPRDKYPAPINTLAAEQILMGTAIRESKLRYLRQIGGGPALGPYQMEPFTHDDHWRTYLIRYPELADKLSGMSTTWPTRSDQLISNLTYATAMARIHYYRVPQPLPQAGDVEGFAHYWKDHFNSHMGHGTVPQFVLDYNEHVTPLYT